MKLILKIFSLLLAVTTVTLFMTSCNKNEQVENDGITVTDALDRQVTVKKEPERVAALIGSFADVWTLAGGKICAAPIDAWEDFSLDLPDAVNIGGAHSPSLEKLVASDPELVIASASTASNVEMKDSLENMGIQVIYFDVDNFYDYLYMLDICTDITGRKDLYKQNGADIQTQIEDIKNRYTKNEKILLLRASSTTVKAKGSYGTVLGEMLMDMGCENIADSNKALLENLSIEAVIKNEPGSIFVVTMGNDSEKASESLKNLFAENPVWQSLCAVKEKKVYIMDKKLFNLKPNSRWAEAYQELYEKLIEE